MPADDYPTLDDIEFDWDSDPEEEVDGDVVFLDELDELERETFIRSYTSGRGVQQDYDYDYDRDDYPYGYQID